MKRLIACMMFALAGCQTAAEEPEQTTVLAGDYQVLSECFYREVSSTPGFRKVEAPAARTSSIEGRAGGGSPDKIDFIATGEGLTKVHAQLGAPGGNEAWARYLQALKQCEKPGNAAS